MVGPSITPNKSKGKQLSFSSKESDVERSSGSQFNRYSKWSCEIVIHKERLAMKAFR